MKKNFIIACNWKMFLSYKETLAWIDDNVPLLTPDNTIEYIICPSSESIAAVQKNISNSTIALGAQHCSPYGYGAHTGQVSAASLKEVGCTYCIVGHSEARSYFHEIDATVTAQLQAAINAKLIPILCIGSTGAVEQEIEKLIPLLRYVPNKGRILIAYEPQGSIGTGIIPSDEQLRSLYDYLYESVQKCKDIDCRLLYGGSVSSTTAQRLYNNAHIDGFLIGKASTNFQELKKIVDLCC